MGVSSYKLFDNEEWSTLLKIKRILSTLVLTILLSISLSAPAQAATYYYYWYPGTNYWNFSNWIRVAVPAPAPSPAPAPTYTLSQFELRVVDLVNVERQKAGLKPLVADILLSKGARAKSQDMIDENYFSHTSPKYGSPFDMMKTFGIQYSYAGENLAAGQTTPEAVVTAWMNSAGHRANILNPNYNKIGVGYAYSNTSTYQYYWTQWFTN